MTSLAEYARQSTFSIAWRVPISEAVAAFLDASDKSYSSFQLTEAFGCPYGTREGKGLLNKLYELKKPGQPLARHWSASLTRFAPFKDASGKRRAAVDWHKATPLTDAERRALIYDENGEIRK